MYRHIYTQLDISTYYIVGIAKANIPRIIHPPPLANTTLPCQVGKPSRTHRPLGSSIPNPPQPDSILVHFKN